MVGGRQMERHAMGITSSASSRLGTLRAASYARVSTSRQDEEGTSLLTQEQGNRAFIAERGWFLDEAHVHRETYTGTELWDRPQLTALRQAIRERQIDVVVCHAIDRLSRDPVHLGVILSEAEHAGVDVVFVTEPLDHSPEGQLIRFVRGYAARVEREKIKERTMRGRAARVDAGKLLPGSCPLYGYAWSDASKGTYVADPSTAPVVQRVWYEALAGTSLRSIAGKQQRWGPSTIYNILTQPAYTGEARAFRRQYTKVKGEGYRAAWRPEQEQASLPAGTIPALVTAEDFAAVQERLRKNRERSARNNRDPEAVLLRGGYARCGYCSGALIAAKIPAGHIYRCSTTSTNRHGCPHFSIMAHVLDTAVWERVAGILKRPETIAAEVARLREDDPTEADLATVDRALEGIGRKQANLTKRLALFDDDESAAPLVAEIASLGGQRRQLEQERAKVLVRRSGWQEAQDRLAVLEEGCRRVGANLGNLTYEQRRLTLDALGVEARVYRSDHEPRYVITASIPLNYPIVSTSP